MTYINKLLLTFFLLLLILPLKAESVLEDTKKGSIAFFDGNFTYYSIVDEIDLKGKTVTLPENATIDFRGGCISNGELVCRNNHFSGKSGIASNVSLSGTILGPLDVAVFILKNGNKSFDIGKLINMAGKVCKNLIVPDGCYYFQTPIKIEKIKRYLQYGSLVYNGKAKDVAVFQFYGGNAAVINIDGKVVYDTDTKVINYTTTRRTNIIGLEFININNSSIYVGDVEYFNNNIRISAYGAGNSYNKYTFGISVFSNEHLRIFQKNLPASQRGWCNENIFIGGRFCNWSHFDWKQCKSVAIKIEGAESGDSYNGVNSLLFIKPCMEGFKDHAVYAKNVTSCHWQDVRTEDCGKFIKFVGECRFNEANSMYGTETVDFEESTTYPLKKNDLFPIHSTNSSSSGSSQVVLEVDTDKAKFFRVSFNDPDVKARIGVRYVSEKNGREIARTAQRTMMRPRSTIHPNSYYFNTGSSQWVLAKDASGSDFIIPEGVSKVQFVLSGRFSGATIYSDQSTKIIEH